MGWPGEVIINPERVTTSKIRADASIIASRHPLDLVAIDSLSQVIPADPRDGERERLGKIAIDLKELAKHLRVPIVLIHHLGRRIAKEVRRPIMQDLEGSSFLDAIVDCVLCVWRPHDLYGLPEGDQDVLSRLNITDVNASYSELVITKQRAGRIGPVRLAWEGSCTRFDTPRELRTSVQQTWRP